MCMLRRLMFFIVLLAIVGVLGAHWFVRSSLGNSSIEKHIASRTGLKASVGSARLTLGLSLVISDLRVWFVSDGDQEVTVLSVPETAVSRHCRSRRTIRMARPVITAVQARRGDWTPSPLRIFVRDGSTFENALVEFAGTIDLSVELLDASLEMIDNTGKVLLTCSGLDWSHGPAFIKGHPGMMHDKATLQCKDGAQIEFASEWLSDGGRVFHIEAPVEMAKSAEDSVVPPSAPASENGVESIAVPAVQKPTVQLEQEDEPAVETKGATPTNQVPAQAEAPRKD